MPFSAEKDVPDWGAVFHMAEEQAVEGLLWGALELYQADPQRKDYVSAVCPHALLLRLAVKADACEKKYNKMSEATRALMTLYESRGLHPLLLKGISSASLYPRPELRASGDIDLYFDGHELAAAEPSVATRHADGSCSFIYRGIEVELHDHILDVSAPKARREAAAIIRECDSVRNASLCEPSPRLRILLLATHILKHALGRGIGLRQFCDYALARSRSDYDRKVYDDDCRRLGISRWARVLDCFCAKYLEMLSGGDFSASEMRTADRLMSRVLKEGNFGRASNHAKGAASTFRAFLSNLPFACRIAPAEAFHNIYALAAGRLKLICKR